MIKKKTQEKKIGLNDEWIEKNYLNYLYLLTKIANGNCEFESASHNSIDYRSM